VEPSIDVTGIDHLYLAVRDFDRSVAFYDRVMRFLGFKKGTFPIAGERHAHYYNRETQISIRPARSDQPHDSYRAGLHHVCLRVADRQTSMPSPPASRSWRSRRARRACIRNTLPTTTRRSSRIPTAFASRSSRCAACAPSCANTGRSSTLSRTRCEKKD
jgi:catechol 2,3-dioxygenase-like lactoylglutathione lyase family enzyme